MILSIFMWLLYLYFIRDALTDVYVLITECFDWAFAGAERPNLSAISGFLNMMKNYAIVILANGAILILWARYNQLRFRGEDRRRPQNAVSVADLADLYGLSVDDVTNWQQSRILVMQHDSNGALIRVVPVPAPSG